MKVPKRSGRPLGLPSTAGRGLRLPRTREAGARRAARARTGLHGRSAAMRAASAVGLRGLDPPRHPGRRAGGAVTHPARAAGCTDTARGLCSHPWAPLISPYLCAECPGPLIVPAQWVSTPVTRRGGLGWGLGSRPLRTGRQQGLRRAWGTRDAGCLLLDPGSRQVEEVLQGDLGPAALTHVRGELRPPGRARTAALPGPAGPEGQVRPGRSMGRGTHKHVPSASCRACPCKPPSRGPSAGYWRD